MSDQIENNEGAYKQREARRDIHIDKERREMFNSLQEKEESPLYGASNHDLFMFAFGYGKANTMPEEIQNEKAAFFGRTSLREQQKAVIEAVAVAEERSVHVLQDQRMVYEIAEKYANAGIKLLHGRVFGPDDEPLRELAVEVKESYEAAQESGE
jgi:hypothetical protein